MRPLSLLTIATLLLTNVSAQAEYEKTPAGSRQLYGREAHDLFQMVVGAGFKAKNLDKWTQVESVTVSTGAIRCSFSYGDKFEGIPFEPQCGDAPIEKSYLLYRLADLGAHSAYFTSGSVAVTDITCTVEFQNDLVPEKLMMQDRAKFSCAVKFPEGIYDDAE